MQKALLVVVGLALGAGATWMLMRPAGGPDVDPAAVARGKTFFQVCAVCHGEHAEGNPDTQAPRLAGQYPWYLERQLRNFRAGIRGADSSDTNGFMMAPMAKGLPSDDAVTDVVAYISTLR